MVLAAEVAPLSPFGDLAATDDNFRYVKFLHDKGIIAGFPDGTFQPLQSLTRAEGAKMLVLATGLPLQTPSHPTYSDVALEHWAYPYIETATELGFLNGYPDGTFRPQQQLTRAETAAIIFKAYGIDYQWFGDTLAADIPGWALEAINMVIDAGLMGVDAEKHFQPNWPTTRVEFARALALLHTIHEEWRLVPLKATFWPQEGAVRLNRPGQDLLEVSMPTFLAVGDVVITGPKAEAEIRFEDGTGLMLKAGSEIKIQKLLGSLFILPDGTEGSAVEDLEMQTRLEELNQIWLAKGEGTFKSGVGLNSGSVIVGNIGSPERMDYTVIGEDVNLASRLEGMNKEYGTSIIISDRTLKCLEGDRTDWPYTIRSLGTVPVRGFEEPIPIYTVESSSSS